MSIVLIGSLACLAYVLAGLSLALAHREPSQAAARRRLGLGLGGLAALLQLGIHLQGWASTGLDLRFFAALSLVGLGMAGLTTLAALGQRIEALGIAVYPIAAASFAAHLLAGPAPSLELGWPLQLHAGLALLAYATLAIATVMAGMLWVQERALRQRQLQGWWRALPPLTQLESLLFRSLGASFGLLSLALLTGVLFVTDLLGQHLAHKTVLSLLSWAVLATLLFGRWRWGWRGPRAIKLTLTAMALLLLAFFGSQFVRELILHRG